MYDPYWFFADSLKIVELLLANGATPDVTFRDTWTPLVIAALNGHADCVELLLKYGARSTICDYSPLYKACQNGHLKVLNFCTVSN